MAGTRGDLVMHGAHRLHRSTRLVANRIDRRGDIAGGRRGALGELPHLVGDDGEAAPLLAGARRFDRRVEREQIGLVGDLADRLGNRLDALGRAGKIGHDARRTIDRRLDAVDRRDGSLHADIAAVGDAARLRGGLGHLARTRRHILRGVGGLLDSLGGPRHVFAARRAAPDDLAEFALETFGGGSQGVGGALHAADDLALAGERRVDRTRHVAQFVAAPRVQVDPEFALGDTRQRAAHFANGARQGTHQRQHHQRQSDGTRQIGTHRQCTEALALGLTGVEGAVHRRHPRRNQLGQGLDHVLVHTRPFLAEDGGHRLFVVLLVGRIDFVEQGLQTIQFLADGLDQLAFLLLGGGGAIAAKKLLPGERHALARFLELLTRTIRGHHVERHAGEPEVYPLQGTVDLLDGQQGLHAPRTHFAKRGARALLSVETHRRQQHEKTHR